MVALAHDDEGRGRAVLFVHGHPFDRTLWRPQVARFAAGHRVIAPDLRGYGRSPVVPGRTPLPEFAADLAELLDRLDVPAAVVVGMSMGGQIAMEFARSFPGRLLGLLLADTSAPADSPEGKRLREDGADRIARDGMAGYTEEVLPHLLPPDADPAVVAHVRRMMLAAPPDGAAAAMRGRADRPDYAASLGAVAVPAAVVVGSRDEYTPVSDAELLHERLPDSVLTVVAGAGHLPGLERPDEFDRALADLLDRIG